jgi:hypothetical protein
MAGIKTGNNKGHRFSRFALRASLPAFGRAVAPFGAAIYGTRERVPFRVAFFYQMYL